MWPRPAACSWEVAVGLTHRLELPVDELIPGVLRIPIQSASPTDVMGAFDACVDDMDHLLQPGFRESVLGRMRKTDPLDLLMDSQGPAGWVGFVPYAPSPLTWESSTFLAPRLRGGDAFLAARCAQAHMGQDLVRKHGDKVALVSSINSHNERAIRASRSYIDQHGWPDSGTIVAGEHKSRKSLLIRWPLPTPHLCFRQTDESGVSDS